MAGAVVASGSLGSRPLGIVFTLLRRCGRALGGRTFLLTPLFVLLANLVVLPLLALLSLCLAALLIRRLLAEHLRALLLLHAFVL